MQRIELKENENFELFCPFCGELIIAPHGLAVCKHTLFHANDEGFEFISKKLKISDEDLNDESVDEFTDKIEYPNAIKFAIYQPMPSGHGGYVAFSNE